jgi:hypothetical protein
MVRRVPRESSILGFNQDHPVGVGVPANLDRLIKRIYVAPRSGSWFKETVETLLAKYGLAQKQVIKSKADNLPDYRRLFEETRHELLGRQFPLAPYEDDYPEDDPWGLKAIEGKSEGT